MPVFLVSFNGRRAPLIFEQHINSHIYFITTHSNIPTLETRSYFTLNLIRFSKLGKDNVYASQYLYTLSRKSQRLFMPNGKYLYTLSRESQRLFKIIFIIILSLFHLHSLFHSPIIITHQYTNQYSNIYTYSNSHHLFITYSYFLLHLLISTLFL